MKTLEKVFVYDPRDKKIKKSNNPALILAEMAMEELLMEGMSKDDFWKLISKMADHCDEMMEKEELNKLIESNVCG
jgi:predicted secreted protein